MEFSYYLAERLRMTVGEMQDRMGNDEFVAWGVYHGRRAQRQELAEKSARAKHGR
ncbi:MAG: hypothetical protein L0H64_23230 [Pseudonocardia sp.]|nr:hypothetical protein [Pseudonocardia sp.]